MFICSFTIERLWKLFQTQQVLSWRPTGEFNALILYNSKINTGCQEREIYLNELRTKPAVWNQTGHGSVVAKLPKAQCLYELHTSFHWHGGESIMTGFLY